MFTRQNRLKAGHQTPIREVRLGLALVFLLLGGCRLMAKETRGDHSPRRIWITNYQSVAVIHIPTPPHRFSVWQKLNPIWWLGNADEPTPPAWYRPGQWGRTFLWHLRNPCHNWDCYVIGLSDKGFTRTGRFPEETFNPYGGWNWGVCHYYWLRFPYLSYNRGHVRAYCGWRPGGAFGLELRRSSEKTISRPIPKAEAQESAPLPARNCKS